LKKFLPAILIGGIIVLVALLLLGSNSSERKFEKRVTLDKKDKNPYGTYLSYNLLHSMFPHAEVAVNRDAPKKWYSKEENKSGTVLFIVSRQFNPSEEEMITLSTFVKNGNYVFLCSPSMDEDAYHFFGARPDNNYSFGYIDSAAVSLAPPAFQSDTFFYPGYNSGRFFVNVDRTKYQELGHDDYGKPNFIRADLGKGSFFLHSNPFMFSNYFLLYHNNINYYQKAVSVIPASVHTVIWDEYYVYRLKDNERAEDPSPLRVLLSINAFKWAFWIAIILLSIYLLLNIKRKQREIPVMELPKNESLEFVKTIGRLYFEKQDHLNLAMKMSVYFLEHVRSKYFMPTSVLDEEFVTKLSNKSGYPEVELQKIIHNITTLPTRKNISQEELMALYQQYQQFYKQTA